jgi:hypothetical protein
MKTRIIYPQLWLDTDFAQCSVDSQLLCLFLVSNPYLGLSRYTRISDRQISFHTSLTGKKLQSAKQELSKIGWFYFEGEWIYHNHSIAYVDYEGRDRVLDSKNEEISKVPEEIKDVFNGLITGFKPVLNTKPETINQKQGECEGKPDEATPDYALKVLEQWNRVYGTSFTSPRSIRSNLSYWLTEYNLDQILEAVERIQYHKFWRDKMNPSTLLRRKNPQGEAVDYIGIMLNETKIPQRIEMSWEITKPISAPEVIPDEVVQRNLEKIREVKKNLGRLSL